ncbi:FadR family transcriptional regulator [Nocardioides sp. zg-ZUI104]|nr:FadR family transcriptional regulator [Nocardioides faecalis]
MLYVQGRFGNVSVTADDAVRPAATTATAAATAPAPGTRGAPASPPARPARRSARHGTRTRSAIFAPLEEVGRATQVEQRLADAIRSGVLRDGERLPSEAELAAMLGVATVTAREALVALRSAGLIATVRGRNGGSYVTRVGVHDVAAQTARLRSMSLVELHDRGTLHMVLLTGCAEVAAERADAGDVDVLESLLPAPGDDDPGHWRHADAELYLSLAALSQSARMTRQVVALEADFGALLRQPLGTAAFQEFTRACHTELFAALRAHDGDAARGAVRRQLGGALDALALLHAANPDAP